jgi:hypothetical protein
MSDPKKFDSSDINPHTDLIPPEGKKVVLNVPTRVLAELLGLFPGVH